MSGTRFDPKDGVPYARCLTEGCGFVADTKEQMSAHADETMAPTGAATGVTARGHSYRVENPSREEALRSEVMREADDALESALTEFVGSVYRLHTNDDVPLIELTAAVKAAFLSHEWDEAWAEYIEDETEEDDEAESGDGLGPQLYQETALFGPDAKDYFASDLEYDAYDMDDPKSPGYAERILASADDRRDEQRTGGV